METTGKDGLGHIDGFIPNRYGRAVLELRLSVAPRYGSRSHPSMVVAKERDQWLDGRATRQVSGTCKCEKKMKRNAGTARS